MSATADADAPRTAHATELPGLRSRPLGLPDAAAAHAVLAAEEVAALGRCDLDVADVESDWARPGLDLRGRSVGYLDGDLLVGYAVLVEDDRVDAGVLPSHHGRGIGSALARWSRERARGAGAGVVGMTVPQGSAPDRFLEAQGYTVRSRAFDLVLPAGVEVPVPSPPRGVHVRDAGVDDERPAWDVLESGFLEWADRPRTPLPDFLARVRGRPGAAPWNLRVAVQDGQVLAAVHVVLAGDDVHVARLGVRPAHRGRGLAQLLLADAFDHGRRHGARRCTLSVDARSGALGLYERVGLRVDSAWVHREVEL
ncbi:hypothetical protein GCM10028777_03450 [Angustibacter speluncae]